MRLLGPCLRAGALTPKPLDKSLVSLSEVCQQESEPSKYRQAPQAFSASPHSLCVHNPVEHGKHPQASRLDLSSAPKK